MKKLLLIFTALFFACSVKADEIKVMPNGTYAMAVSPNGRYLVGYNPSTAESGVGTESFLYDYETSDFKWMTSFTGRDWSKAGYFKDVNDMGTICGSIRDTEHVVTFEGTDAPTNVAAVFENGKVIKLPYGDLDLTKINQHEDGTFARSISNDGKVVVGYCACSHSAINYPCKWERGANDQWTFSRLELPEGYNNGVAINVSEDGRIIIGLAIKGYDSTACYWIDGKCNLVKFKEEDAQLLSTGQMRVIDMSPNGRYFIFAFSRYSGYRIFDIQEGTYRTLPSIDDKGIWQLPSVTDHGDVFGAMKCDAENNVSTFYKNYWYQYSSNRIFDLTYYLQLFNPSLSMPFSLNYEDNTQASVCGVSGNGNTLIGNKDATAVPNAWMLNVTRKDVLIPATPDRVTGKSTAFRQATINWKADKTSYENLQLTGYNVYQNGKKITTINTVTDEMTYTCKELPAGYLQFSVEGIYKDAQGNVTLSPRSASTSIAIPDNYSLPLFEDFESASLTENYWTMEKDYGEADDAQWAVGQYLGYSGSIGAISGTMSQKPYSASLVSRPFDATKQEKVKCSFIFLGRQEMADNGGMQDLTKDTLSIEYSLDMGKTWKSVKDWGIGELPSSDAVMDVDLTDAVAGHLFQLRFHKYGLGAAKFYFYIDNIKIGAGGETDAPEGLMGNTTKDKEVILAWKNSRKSYTLSYLTERPGSSLTLGNEGLELIGANKFTAKELEMYNGKYLTSVTGYINFEQGEDEITGEEIHASVVVFEDGKLIREQEMEAINYNENTTQKLNEPVLIDSSKELIVGIKIHDYDPEQIPLTYGLSDACIPGKSDLYSRDNGKTWESVWEFYEGDEYSGLCCWDITANICDQPDDEVEQDQSNIIGYNVFRNGVQLNGVCIPDGGTRYIDKQPLPTATYHVIAYYTDGIESVPSEAIVIGESSDISTPAVDNSLIRWDKTCISLKEQGTLAILSTDGRVIAQSNNGNISLANLPTGIYIVSAECGHKNFSMKIAVRH